MSSSSTTWTTDTNTKSGVVQIYESNVSVLKILGIEGGNSILELFADQGDDNADKWRMWVNASDDDLHFANYTSGAWADLLTIQDSGLVGIGTASPEHALHVITPGQAEDGILKVGGDAANVGLEIEYDQATTTTAKITCNPTYTNTGALMHICVDGDANANQLVLKGDGNVGIGETVPDAQLCINQAALDTAILSFKSSDVAHGITSKAETDTYGSFLKAEAAAGGLEIRGLKDSGGVAGKAISMFGMLGEAADTTHTASGVAVINLDCAIQDSGTPANVAAVGADGNLFCVTNNGNTRFIIDEDGDIFYDGAAAAYDNYDDSHLIRALDTYKSPNDIIQTKFDEFLKYKKSSLEDSGIIYKCTPEEEARGEKPFVCITKLQKLHNGAIWQQYTELEKMKELMYDAMVELMGKEKADKKLDSYDIKLLDKDLLN
jgi:hypothetical protein